MENSKDIVLFLGAGFSCDAGLPTMSKFGTAAEHELKKEINEWSNNKNYDDPIKYFTRAGYIFKGFQDYCETAKKFISFNSNNMEDIFCIAEQYKFINKKEEIELMKQSGDGVLIF